MKGIVKEIIIMLLLLLAIILALGVLFYNYMPTSKVVPVVEEYTVSEGVSESLANDILADTSKVIVTKEIDSSDLSIYEKNKDYSKGKANPFEVTSTTTTKSTTGTSQGQANSSQTQTINNNSQATKNSNNNVTNSINNINEASDENDYLANTSRNSGSK